jgi:hypothetical protein
VSFSYRVRKDGTVVVTWEDEVAATLRGRAAEAFLADAADMGPTELQEVMARVTGNFKRGNERWKNPWKG